MNKRIRFLHSANACQKLVTIAWKDAHEIQVQDVTVMKSFSKAFEKLEKEDFNSHLLAAIAALVFELASLNLLPTSSLRNMMQRFISLEGHTKNENLKYASRKRLLGENDPGGLQDSKQRWNECLILLCKER